MQFVLGLLLVSVVGAGMGFGLSKMLNKPLPPQAVEAAANSPADAKSDPLLEGKIAGKPEAKRDEMAHKEGALVPNLVPAQLVPKTFTAAELKDVVMTPFPTITSNLALPDTVWIRLEGTLAIKPNVGVKPADVAQLASSQMVSFLRTLKLTDIQGTIGFRSLNSDLDELVRNATDGQARAVLISGFIVE